MVVAAAVVEGEWVWLWWEESGFRVFDLVLLFESLVVLVGVLVE